MMIWALNRYVQRYRLMESLLANTPLWSALWIQLRRASHYSIIKIIRQLDNSKSISLYLFYSLIITITIMSDGGALFCVKSDAQARESANANSFDPKEKSRRLWVKLCGNTDQTYQPRPQTAFILRVSRWGGWPWQRNAKHADRLPIKRCHQEERRQEAVNCRS